MSTPLPRPEMRLTVTARDPCVPASLPEFLFAFSARDSPCRPGREWPRTRARSISCGTPSVITLPWAASRRSRAPNAGATPCRARACTPLQYVERSAPEEPWSLDQQHASNHAHPTGVADLARLLRREVDCDRVVERQPLADCPVLDEQLL